MQFAYEGFTHEGNDRCFRFRPVGLNESAAPFLIKVALGLFAQNQVRVQDGPRFCVDLLQTAFASDPTGLNRFHTYRVVSEDFRSLLVKRKRELALKAVKKPHFTPPRKPSLSSNLFLGIPNSR
jgi:hypothetical protein